MRECVWTCMIVCVRRRLTLFISNDNRQIKPQKVKTTTTTQKKSKTQITTVQVMHDSPSSLPVQRRPTDKPIYDIVKQNVNGQQ